MLKSKKFLIGIASVVLFCCLQIATAQVQSDSLINDESKARELLQEIDDIYWQSATSYRKFSDETFSPEILMREKLRPFYEKMQKYDWRHFQDPLMKRQFEIILRGTKFPPLDYNFKLATQNLKSMSRHKWACRREDQHNGTSKSTGNCNMAFVPHIKSIFTNSDDLEEVKYYWKEWRDKLPQDVKDALLYYVHYYQNLSTPEMNATALWYDQYEDPNFIRELESLMETIRPFYRELHAHIVRVLKAKYGHDVIPESGLIPHHLMEQVTYQAWKKETVLKNPFPERKLPNLQAEMDSNKIKTPYDLVEASAYYFGVMGFPNLTDDFMREHFYQMETGSGGPDCKSRIFDFGEIELQYCPKVYYKKLLQTHGDMARVQYAIAKNNKKVGLNQEACPGFGNAMGEAVILSVSNPKHLQKGLHLLEGYDYDDFLNLNRLYRHAVHTLLTLPTYFVHEKLWIDMINGVVTPENYNCHYWNLMQDYMGVEAPVQTVNGTFDMPYKFYEGIIDQYRSTKKVFGEFLGYQIYRAICLEIGEFVRGNAYKTLDNCDFGCHQNAGTLLRDMMASGSSKPWREIIKPLTKRQLTKLSATAFLEYFEPIHNWLSEDNAERDLKVGWTASDKCRR